MKIPIDFSYIQDESGKVSHVHLLDLWAYGWLIKDYNFDEENQTLKITFWCDEPHPSPEERKE